MANVAGAGTLWNLPNIDGMLFNRSKITTPFLSSLNNVAVAQNNEFAMGAGWDLEAASQPAITETASLTAPTPVSYTRDNELNVTQIYQKKVSVSYQKLSNGARLVFPERSTSGLAYTTHPGENSAPDEWVFQVESNLKQIRVDMEYTFLNGTYALSTAASVAYGTKGIITGSIVNTVAASSADLTKALINSLLKEMADNAADFEGGRFVMFCNSFQKQAISDLYAYEPPSRDEAGRNIQLIFTDFAPIEVRYSHTVPAATILIADMNKCGVVFTPVPRKTVGESFMILEPLSKTGAGEDWQLFGQVGLDYTSAIYHGTLTGLSTS